MILKRFGSTPMGTFGKLSFYGKELVTVERPWLANTRFVSCVPLGHYQLLWRETTTPVPNICEGCTWYLYSDDVGFQEEAGDKKRYNCCFHIGNTANDVSGCIAVGMDFGFPRDQWGVVSSRNAMEVLYSAIGPHDTELTVIGSLMG